MGNFSGTNGYIFTYGLFRWYIGGLQGPVKSGRPPQGAIPKRAVGWGHRGRTERVSWPGRVPLHINAN